MFRAVRGQPIEVSLRTIVLARNLVCPFFFNSKLAPLRWKRSTARLHRVVETTATYVEEVLLPLADARKPNGVTKKSLGVLFTTSSPMSRQ